MRTTPRRRPTAGCTPTRPTSNWSPTTRPRRSGSDSAGSPCRGGRVVAAWVQFTVDEPDTAPCSLRIRAVHEAAPTAFRGWRGITIRPTTANFVGWNPRPWPAAGASGAAQRTPDLAAILQPIFDRADWAAGNPVALVINRQRAAGRRSQGGPAGRRGEATHRVRSSSGRPLRGDQRLRNRHPRRSHGRLPGRLPPGGFHRDRRRQHPARRVLRRPGRRLLRLLHRCLRRTHGPGAGSTGSSRPSATTTTGTATTGPTTTASSHCPAPGSSRPRARSATTTSPGARCSSSCSMPTTRRPSSAPGSRRPWPHR